MIYNDRLTPPANWPSLVRYPAYYPDRRLSLLWFPVLAAVTLTLSVVGLIIVFAVEHSWFSDSFQTGSQYGLWRACIMNFGCDSWFSTNANFSKQIENRLTDKRAGLNAWQALEIIFLFLTTSTLIILVIALICYRIRHSLHYYLSILAVFCVWPAVCIGIACLFVFGFAVFNTSPTPRDLDWCFYVNLASVILALLGAILLSIYDGLLRKPVRHGPDDAVVETFADLNDYPPGLSPSTFVVVRRNKNKRNRPYEYPQILYPNISYPKTVTTTTMNGTVTNGMTSADYLPNANRQTLTPYTSIVTTTKETNTTIPPSQPQQQQQPPAPLPAIVASNREFEYNRPDLVPSSSATIIGRQPISIGPTQSYRPAVPAYRYQPESPPTVQWRRTDPTFTNRLTSYDSGRSNDYLQRDSYYPTRYQPTERTSYEQKQEPRVLHYYTGYDYFATIDPSDTVLMRHHPAPSGPGTAMRYNANPSYYQSSDYITSTM